jgi:Tfp pilus assembly protein PilO
MRRNELTIGLVLALLGMLAGFWLIILSPKREEASSLKDDADQLQSQLEQTQQAAAAGKQARESFPDDYRNVVVLGKAVPEDGDQASLLVQLQRLADKAGVRFQAIDLSETADAAAPAPAPTTSSSDSGATDSAATSSSSSGEPAPEPTADATEAAAASLPIGASVGPAGLPVMPYQLKFTGNFFQIADFMKRVDGMVRTRRSSIGVDGRLITVDSFILEPIDSEGSSPDQAPNPVPTLTAELAVTTYLTPADQGATAGATPAGPAPGLATPTPTSTTTDSTGAVSSTAASTAP